MAIPVRTRSTSLSPEDLALTLGELSDYMSKISSTTGRMGRNCRETLPIIAAVKESAQAEEAVIRRGGTSTCPQLERLADPTYLPELLLVPQAPQTGHHYLIPVIVAWGFLAMTEWLYSRSPRDVGLFTWWSEQGWLGPAAYSGIIALLLAILLVIQGSTNRRATWAAGIEAKIARYSARIAAQSAGLLRRRSETDLGGATADLRRATESLRNAVTDLGSLAAPINNQSVALHQFTASIDTMQGALSAFSTTVDQLVAGAGALGRSSTSLTDAIDGLDSSIAGLTAGVGYVTAATQVLGETSRDIAAEVTRQVDANDAAQSLLSSREDVVGAHIDVIGDGIKATSSLQAMMPKLHEAVAGLQRTTEQLKKPAEHLALALTIVDAPATDRRTDQHAPLH